MTVTRVVESFAEWRQAARGLLAEGLPPEAVLWTGKSDQQAGLFDGVIGHSGEDGSSKVSIPRSFVDGAELVACHSNPARWALLYRLLWRMQHGVRDLLVLEMDDDVRAFTLMKKSVGRDIHQMQAFVRFRRVATENGEEFVAWYRPDHFIVEKNAKFFVDRFGSMRWAILTPDRSVFWDLKRVRFGPGVPRSAAPAEDELDDLWRTYYKSTFNPARLNLAVMRQQLPVRRWENLPEARTIPEAVREVRGRVDGMRFAQPRSPADFVPAGAPLAVLRESVGRCGACALCREATGAVFGEGPAEARIVVVGEQPGDEEDLAGRPFVGPAGAVLRDAMEEAGLRREDVYLTNAVKAFKFTERGKRRIHQNPKSIEIATCRPWLEAELDAIHPAGIVCLGGSAGHAVFGRSVRVNEERGTFQAHPRADWALLTYHPSAALRVKDDAAGLEIRRLLALDLTAARRASLSGAAV